MDHKKLIVLLVMLIIKEVLLHQLENANVMKVLQKIKHSKLLNVMRFNQKLQSVNQINF